MDRGANRDHGQERGLKMSEWERWVESLNHKDECRTLHDVVEQIAYDCIVHGGDMGPNGNVCEMVD